MVPAGYRIRQYVLESTNAFIPNRIKGQMSQSWEGSLDISVNRPANGAFRDVVYTL